MVQLTKKKIIAIAVAVVVVATALYTVYDLNGKSFDLSGREARIVVTGSMDGSTHPDGYWHCDDCGAEWIPKILKVDPTQCTHCSSTHIKKVAESFSIGRIPVHALIMTKLLGTDEKDSIALGDVLSFQYSGRETIHRVIDIQRDSNGHIVALTTSGDNVSGTENPTLADVHGVVVGESPLIGNIVNFVQSSFILLLLVIVILGVMISVIRDMYKMSQADKKRRMEALQEEAESDDEEQQQK